jgi:thiazole synthase ThiGH ThiG subunit
LCALCRPDDGTDSMQILRGIITAIDPVLDPAAMTAAISVAAGAGRRHQLAGALQDRPELLTGAGAQAGVPSVLRLSTLAIADMGIIPVKRPG